MSNHTKEIELTNEGVIINMSQFPKFAITVTITSENNTFQGLKFEKVEKKTLKTVSIPPKKVLEIFNPSISLLNSKEKKENIRERFFTLNILPLKHNVIIKEITNTKQKLQIPVKYKIYYPQTYKPRDRLIHLKYIYINDDDAMEIKGKYNQNDIAISENIPNEFFERVSNALKR